MSALSDHIILGPKDIFYLLAFPSKFPANSLHCLFLPWDHFKLMILSFVSGYVSFCPFTQKVTIVVQFRPLQLLCCFICKQYLQLYFQQLR